MKEQESLGGCSILVLCTAVSQPLAHCFLPGNMNVLTQGPPSYTQQTVLWACFLRRHMCNPFTMSKGQFSGAVLRYALSLTKKKKKKKVDVRSKKPGSGLIYIELLELLAVFCMSILVCVQAVNFIRKKKNSQKSPEAVIFYLPRALHCLPLGATYIHLPDQADRLKFLTADEVQVTFSLWSPHSAEHTLPDSPCAGSSPDGNWGSLGSLPDHQDSRSQLTLLMLKSLLPGWKRVIPDMTLLSRSHYEISWSARGISRLGVWLASFPWGF